MKTRLNFYSEMLFPFHFLAIGVAFSFGGLAGIFFSPVLSSILLVIGLLIVTAYRGLQFNLSSNTYRVYNSFLFIKFGKWEKLGTIRQLFINESEVSQTIYMRLSQGSTYEYKEYNGYLELEDGDKVYLASRKNKVKLFKKLEALSGFLQCEITDTTNGFV